MTAEGRLARGKENFERGRFLKNSETMAIAKIKDTKTKFVAKLDKKIKETKDAKSTE